MSDARIPYGRQTIDDADVQAVADVLRSDWLTQGPKVEEFERALAQYCGAKHAVSFANGTAALQAAYFALGLGEREEVVSTSLTFAATTNAALWFGAKPVFADIDEATGNLDPAEAERKITKKTRVLAVVDYAGRPANLAAFRELAKRKKLVLLEDACHSLGASFGGRKVGAIADMSVFSFHPVKSITTGEGGAVLTDNEEYARRLASFRTHGMTKRHPDWRYEIGELGQNYRLTDIQAALGLSQLKKLDGFIAKRAALARAYEKDFAKCDLLTLPPAARGGGSAWHLYPVRLRLEHLSIGRAEAFARLREAGIGVQVHYIPVYHHPLYRKLGYKSGLCPKAEAFYEAELSLPIFPALAEADRCRVVEAVLSILRSNNVKVLSRRSNRSSPKQAASRA